MRQAVCSAPFGTSLGCVQFGTVAALASKSLVLARARARAYTGQMRLHTEEREKKSEVG